MITINKEWLKNKCISDARKRVGSETRFDLQLENDRDLFLNLVIRELADELAEQKLKHIEGK